MTRARVLVLAALLGMGCSRHHVDPPPPASSAGLPQAPPHALGARAASRVQTTPAGPGQPLPGGVPHLEVPAPSPSAPPAAPDQPEEAGVPL